MSQSPQSKGALKGAEEQFLFSVDLREFAESPAEDDAAPASPAAPDAPAPSAPDAEHPGLAAAAEQAPSGDAPASSLAAASRGGPSEADRRALEETMTVAERVAFARTSPEFLLDRARRAFHRALLDARVLVLDPASGLPSNADKDSGSSVRYARAIAEGIGAVEPAPRAPGQGASRNFERAVAAYLQSVFPAMYAVRPGEWVIRRLADRGEAGASEDASGEFEQYEHLAGMRSAVEGARELRALFGEQTQMILPDVVIARVPAEDASLNETTRLVDPRGSLASLSPLRAAVQPKLLLHAAVACKWTLRSDRAQQIRAEAEHLRRHRRGRAPHLVLVTGEPMPTRLASVALGTGEIDCVYHFALHELMNGIDPQRDPAGAELLHTMVQGRRLRDIADLPLDLAV